jgi:H+/Cl- antiporter ClcA
VKWVSYILISLLCALAALFALDNNELVTFNLKLFSISLTLPFFLWLWMVLLLGMLISCLWFYLKQLGQRDKDHEIDALKAELAALKCEEHILQNAKKD